MIRVLSTLAARLILKTAMELLLASCLLSSSEAAQAKPASA